MDDLTKPKRSTDHDKRAFIRRHPCIFCRGYNPNTHCCHAYTGGLGTKCSDEFTFPGCQTHHDLYDGRVGGGRKEFMATRPDIDLPKIMEELDDKYQKEIFLSNKTTERGKTDKKEQANEI